MNIKALVITILTGAAVVGILGYGIFNPVVLLGLLIVIALLALAAILLGSLVVLYDTLSDRFDRHAGKK